MRYFNLVLVIVIFVLGWLFLDQNREVLSTAMSLQLAIPYGPTFRSIDILFSVVVVLAFALGFILAVLYLLIDKLRSVSRLRQCRTRMASLEQELNSLRNMPINDDQTYSSTSENGSESNA